MARWPESARAARLRAGWLLAIAVTGLGSAARAQDLNAHAAAGARFEALRAAQSAAMPRLADPPAAEVLRTLADVQRFLPARAAKSNAAPSPAELSAVADTCGRVRDAVVAYQSFGALQGGQLVPQRLLDNGATYQDELALLQPFLAHCIARQVPLAEAALQQIDARTRLQLRLGGLRRGQAAVMQLYASLSAALADARVRPAHTQTLLSALAQTANVHVRALPLADRRTLRKMAQVQLQGGAGDAARNGPRAEAWRRIERAMAEPRCAALCELAAAASR